MNHEQQPQISGLRIIDNDGAVWPITGSRCLICKMPRDPAVTDPRHPGCRPAHLIPDASFDHLVAYLTQHLGAAVEIAPNKKEMTA